MINRTRFMRPKTALGRDYALAVGSRPENAGSVPDPGLEAHAGLELVRKLGSGAYGTVWLGRDSGGWSALKQQQLLGPQSLVAFRHEVVMQRAFSGISCAPAIRRVWTVARPASGVIQMDPVDGTVSDLVKRHAYNPTVLAYAARQVLRLCAAAASAGLIHGDPHFGNMAVEMDDARTTPKFVFIDFGRSIRAPVDTSEDLLDADRFLVWRATQFRPELNRPLVVTGFPGSRLMRAATGSDKPDVATIKRHSTRIEDATYRLVNALVEVQEADNVTALNIEARGGTELQYGADNSDSDSDEETPAFLRMMRAG